MCYGNIVSTCFSPLDSFIGDIALLKEENMKPNQFPMAIVKSIVENDLGEVTGAVLFKGKT